MTKLEEIERLAIIVARPWRLATYTLIVLLLISVGSNVYQAVRSKAKNITNEATLSDSNHNMLSFKNE